MARKVSEQREMPKKSGHAINVSADLAEMLNIISARRKTTIKEMVDSWLRPLVVKSYVDVMRELNEMTPKSERQ